MNAIAPGYVDTDMVRAVPPEFLANSPRRSRLRDWSNMTI
nr:hypothetical protein [uncultured Glaciecola sp.]